MRRAHAAATPDAPALAEADSDAISYADLLSAARRRAHLLAAQGLKPGQVAALLVDLNAQGQGQDLITSLLAIWEAGATFLPLNADDPDARLQMLANDADIALILTPSAHLAKASALATAVAFDDPEVIAAEANMPDTALTAPNADADAALSAASPLFDAIFMDLAATLAQGGMLIRLTARNLASPDYLQSAADKHQANYLDLTPTVWRAALSTGWTPAKGFQAVTGGEAIDATLAKRICAKGATLTNSYGPTEATVVAIAAEITLEDIAQNARHTSPDPRRPAQSLRPRHPRRALPRRTAALRRLPQQPRANRHKLHQPPNTARPNRLPHRRPRRMAPRRAHRLYGPHR